MPDELDQLVQRLDGIDKAVSDTAAKASRAGMDISRKLGELEDLRKVVQEELQAAKIEVERLAGQRMSEISEQHADLENLWRERTACCPWLAEAVSRYHELFDEKLAHRLAWTGRAPKAAETLKLRSQKFRVSAKELSLARSRLAYYEALFPWLDEYVGISTDALLASASVDVKNASANDDPVRDWIPQFEYETLSPSQRNQRALDNWRRSRAKAPWQLGRDYERFIGYEYESNGFRVTYHGASEGLEDMGRDLIATKGRETLVVQCKFWAQHKQIHEKHVFQVYGTTVQMCLDARDSAAGEAPLFVSGESWLQSGIRPVLVTSTSLSDKAKKFAEQLGVIIRERVELPDNYPIIKCNISQKDQEKIYHLPFDQQYDTTVVEPKRGEFYASTVAQAEKAGFRRAWRFRAGF